METVYYTLDARAVSCCDMASGEALPRYVIRPKLREEEPSAGDGGKVLDVAAYRKTLEEREEILAEEAAHADEEIQVRALPPQKWGRAGLVLDLLATGAVLAMATAVTLAFLPLL